jgi:hypothetical protein
MARSAAEYHPEQTTRRAGRNAGVDPRARAPLMASRDTLSVVRDASQATR